MTFNNNPDLSLTYQKAMELGWEWIMDVHRLELLTLEERQSSEKFIEDGGYVVGLPKDDVPSYIGLYRQLLVNLPIDETLTPESAASRGYEFINNTIYDREAPVEAMQEIIDLVTDQGYKLGQPASVMGEDIFVGLYAPVEKETRVK